MGHSNFPTMRVVAVIVLLGLVALAYAAPMKTSQDEFSPETRKRIAEAFSGLTPEEQSRLLTSLRMVQLRSSGSCNDTYCRDPDCGRNVTQLITSKGYPCEEHKALTPDGYWLSMQRIPHGRNQNATSGRPVVLLQHGLEDASH